MPDESIAQNGSQWPGWCTIESEPAVFNQLLKEIGVSEVSVQEIYSLDEESLRSLSPAYGLIFLFRWRPEAVDNIESTCPDEVWFANQVIDNACASLALLNIVFNSSAKLGAVLQSFKDYSMGLTPPHRGLAVANFEHVRKVHNSFARRSEMTDVDLNLQELATSKARTSNGEAEDDEGVFHFIAYVHVGDTLWEIDGLKRQPVKLHTCPKESWLSFAGPSVQKRIARYSEEELRFNLLAVVPQTTEDTTWDTDYQDIAYRRKFDYEAFAHDVATMLEPAQVVSLLSNS